MTWDFHVGMKVVCINDSPCYSPEYKLVKGEVYIIRKVRQYYWSNNHLNSTFGVYLKGIERINERGIDVPFGNLRFRPLNETPKHIELFRKIALDATEKKRVTIDA